MQITGWYTATATAYLFALLCSISSNCSSWPAIRTSGVWVLPISSQEFSHACVQQQTEWRFSGTPASSDDELLSLSSPAFQPAGLMVQCAEPELESFGRLSYWHVNVLWWTERCRHCPFFDWRNVFQSLLAAAEFFEMYWVLSTALIFQDWQHKLRLCTSAFCFVVILAELSIQD